MDQERDYERYRRRLKDLSDRLTRLIEDGAHNERTFQRFRNFEISLLSADSLSETLLILLEVSKSHFSLDAVELVFYDPEGSLAEVLEDLPQSVEHLPLTLVPRQENVQRFYDGRPRPLALSAAALQARMIFGGRREIQSALVLPMVRHQTLVGSLHMGSNSPDRFTSSKALDFVSHMASIVAVCLENAISQEHLRRLSVIDVLTRVKNRRGFDAALEKEISRAARTTEPLSLLFIDLDHFKRINDRYGHQVGDRTLKVVAQHVRALLRKTDQLARYGGEEFAALLPSCPLERAQQIADRVRAEVSQLRLLDDNGEPFTATLSVGLSCWQPVQSAEAPEVVAQSLVRAADEAVYQAKSEGRNRVCCAPFVLRADLLDTSPAL